MQWQHENTIFTGSACLAQGESNEQGSIPNSSAELVLRKHFHSAAGTALKEPPLAPCWAFGDNSAEPNDTNKV